MKIKKTIYYHDLLNDEFSGTNIKRKPLPENYKYLHKNPFYRALSWFLYYIIAYPIVKLFVFLGYHVKVKGKKNMRHLRHSGVFFYGNHTQVIDALTAQVNVSRGKRTYIVANQDSTSIPLIRGLVTMLGCLPTPENPSESAKFMEAVEHRIKQKCGISIFPEAHIWPYYTHIRPFGDDAFYYPAVLGTPCMAMVTTYRSRRFFKNRRPYPTIHLSRPIYPDMSLSLADRKKQLRDRVYEFMLDYSADEENVEYIHYVKAEEEAK